MTLKLPASPAAEETASKRRRTDNPVGPPEAIVPLDPELSYTHRKSLPGRASLSNAADNFHFSKRRALVFNFVDREWLELDTRGESEGVDIKHDRAHEGQARALMEQCPSCGYGSLGEGIGEQAGDISSSETLAPPADQPTFNMDEFYRRLTRWIVTGNQPFTEVENPEFLELLGYIKPALQKNIIESQAIRDRVFSHAGTLRQSMKKYLGSLTGLMAIACDAWTSSNRIAFLAITGSWVTHDWRLEETLLDFVELKGAHDGQNMATAVSAVLNELGLEDKIVALVSDNVSSNGTLVRHLSTQLKRSSPASRWDQDRGRIRCLAHIIHLAVMVLLKEIKAVPASTDIKDFDPSDRFLTPEEAESFVAENNNESAELDESTTPDPMVNLSSAVSKIRKIAKIVRSSPQRMELFRTTAERIESYKEQQAAAKDQSYTRKTIKTLILDVATRWNSVFFMLERALEFSEAINALTSHPMVNIYRRYALSPTDWASIREICNWLKYFRSASEMMSSEKYPTLSYSIRVYFILISYVSNLETTAAVRTSPALSAGVRACKDKLFAYFDKSNHDSEYYYFATILDPRFKDTLFKSHEALASKLFSKDWKMECATAFHDTCNKFYNTQGADESHRTAPSEVEEPDSDDEFSRAWKAQIPSPPPDAPASISLSSEITDYLKEPLTKTAPLTWWRLNEHRFPRLAPMARDFLCIPGSSVAVERVFSSGRDVISVRRASLSAETIRVLMTYRAGIMLEKGIAGGFTVPS